MGWVPGRLRIFPRIKLVSLGGVLWGQASVIGLYFPVSMGFFEKNLDVRADVVFWCKGHATPDKIFVDVSQLKKPFFDFYATSSNIDDSRRWFTATNLVSGLL